MKVFFKGQRVIAGKFGTGVILGFEVFDTKGFPLPLSDFDDPLNRCRIVVKLDNPEAWKPTEQTPNPFMLRHEVTEIKE